MRKKLLEIAFLVTILVFSPFNTKALSNTPTGFPALQKGVFYEYNATTTNQPQLLWENVRSWSWKYSVLDVYKEGEHWVTVLNVTHFDYVNGSYVGSGSYKTKVYVDNLPFFEVFFNTSKLVGANSSVVEFVERYTSNFTISYVNYTYSGRILKSVRADYFEKDNKSVIWGYFIISIEYGIILEKANFVAKASNNTEALSLKPMQQSSVMKLTRTNNPSLAKGEQNNVPNISMSIYDWGFVGVLLGTLLVIAVMLLYARREKVG